MSRKSESSDLFRVLNLIKEKWYICVSLAVLFALLTCGYFVYFKAPQFVASSTIFVYNDSAAETSEGAANYNDVLTAEKLAKDCQIIATSNAVLNEVRANIPDIDVSPRNIDVTLVTGSRIIELSVTDENPRNAAEIANNVSDVLIKVALDKIKVQDMEIIDYANIPLTPVDDLAVIFIIAAALLGVIVGIGIILLLDLFNKTINTAEDITENFDVAVLVSIPEVDNLKKQLGNKKKTTTNKEEL
ncbi:MAG: hypothetical protein IKV89_03155 [Clostridia bacterium]|nr:hypothetical protein [Clostridia bacterium]